MQHLTKKHVLNGEFDLVQRLMFETDFMEFEEAYISSAHGVESMMFYTCILDMVKHEESSEMHSLAFLSLVYSPSEYEGTLDSAYYHAGAPVKLADDREAKSLLQVLLLHAIPTPVILDKKTFDITKQVLRLDPNNNVACNVLEDTAKHVGSIVVDTNKLHQRSAR